MESSQGHCHDATASARYANLDIPELRHLAEAQKVLERAQTQAKWKRECKKLQSAAHAVRVAALAAHAAGIGWNQIGDVLGIDRAMTPSGSPQIGPPQAPHPSSEAETAGHRAQHIVAATPLHFERPNGFLVGAHRRIVEP